MICYGYPRTLFTYGFIGELLFKADSGRVSRCRNKETSIAHSDIAEFDGREMESLFVEAIK
jgi:hypothetical protein